MKLLNELFLYLVVYWSNKKKIEHKIMETAKI